MKGYREAWSSSGRAHTFLGQSVDVWCAEVLRPVHGQVHMAQVVRHDENDVRPVRRGPIGGVELSPEADPGHEDGDQGYHPAMLNHARSLPMTLWPNFNN